MSDFTMMGASVKFAILSFFLNSTTQKISFNWGPFLLFKTFGVISASFVFCFGSKIWVITLSKITYITYNFTSWQLRVQIFVWIALWLTIFLFFIFCASSWKEALHNCSLSGGDETHFLARDRETDAEAALSGSSSSLGLSEIGAEGPKVQKSKLVTFFLL